MQDLRSRGEDFVLERLGDHLAMDGQFEHREIDVEVIALEESYDIWSWPSETRLVVRSGGMADHASAPRPLR